MMQDYSHPQSAVKKISISQEKELCRLQKGNVIFSLGSSTFLPITMMTLQRKVQ